MTTTQRVFAVDGSHTGETRPAFFVALDFSSISSKQKVRLTTQTPVRVHPARAHSRSDATSDLHGALRVEASPPPAPPEPGRDDLGASVQDHDGRPSTSTARKRALDHQCASPFDPIAPPPAELGAGAADATAEKFREPEKRRFEIRR